VLAYLREKRKLPWKFWNWCYLPGTTEMRLGDVKADDQNKYKWQYFAAN
jgi:hypothetical protein